mmetsp:Transcript_30864/g.56150  ORF Transcript_30864/g.56150 Transcript_30864/m.56150 type:complete len:289 (-) Transcript_30864:183-1049(-)
MNLYLNTYHLVALDAHSKHGRNDGVIKCLPPWKRNQCHISKSFSVNHRDNENTSSVLMRTRRVSQSTKAMRQLPSSSSSDSCKNKAVNIFGQFSDTNFHNVPVLNLYCTKKTSNFLVSASAATEASSRLEEEDALELTPKSVEIVLKEVRPYLLSDGGDVEFVSIDEGIVKLRLRGACGSCPSSTVTMTMGIKRRMMERIPNVKDVIELTDEVAKGLPLTKENIEGCLNEMRPYLSGTGGGGLSLVEINYNIIKICITGPAAKIKTIRVAITQKLREKISGISAVQIV